MCDSVYKAIIMPINQCHLSGIERVVKSEIIGCFRVTIMLDNFKQYRSIITDREKQVIVSGILFDQFRTIRFKHTMPEYRGQQLTKQLLAYTESVVKKKFKHSDSLTESGLASI